MNNEDLNKTIMTNFDLEETELHEEETGFWEDNASFDPDATVFQDENNLEETMLREEPDGASASPFHIYSEESVSMQSGFGSQDSACEGETVFYEEEEPGFLNEGVFFAEKLPENGPGRNRTSAADNSVQADQARAVSGSAAKKTSENPKMQSPMDFAVFEEEAENMEEPETNADAGDILNRSIAEMNQMLNGPDPYSLSGDLLSELRPMFDNGIFTMYYRSRPEKLKEWVQASSETKTALLLKVCGEIGRALIGTGHMVSDQKQGTIFEADVFCVPELKQANIQGLHSWMTDVQSKGKDGRKTAVQLIFRGTRENVAPTLQASNVLDKEFSGLQIRREIKFMKQQPTLSQTIETMKGLASLLAPKNYSSLMATSDQMKLAEGDKKGGCTVELDLMENAFERTKSVVMLISELASAQKTLEQNDPKNMKELLLVQGCSSMADRLKKLYEVRVAEEVLNTQTAQASQLAAENSLLQSLERSGDSRVNAALAELQKEGLQANVSLWTRQGPVQTANDWWMKRTKTDRISACLEAAENLSLLYFFKPKMAMSVLSGMPYSLILLNTLVAADLLRKEEPWKMESGTSWAVPFIRHAETHNAWVKACEVLQPCAQALGLKIMLNPALCWQKISPDEWEPVSQKSGK